ncbi:hypothetical protein GCM10007968_27060 [Sporolactobacillus putidus]|uniref:Uncharacterized protein n=1 Tax=Sporolactobacillus putidus TaxID=492735 RepID=A0A917W473_9BACL|nr:hypothetical protein GCM10007968_27060 [Sporolactobacillus putidus]
MKLLILIGIGFGLYRTKEASGIQKQVVAGRNLKDADGLTGNRTGSRRLAVAEINKGESAISQTNARVRRLAVRP